MFGITEFGAIINPPQSSILAVGAIQKLPKVIEDIKCYPLTYLNQLYQQTIEFLMVLLQLNYLKDFNDIIENPFEVWLQSKDMEII